MLVRRPHHTSPTRQLLPRTSCLILTLRLCRPSSPLPFRLKPGCRRQTDCPPSLADAANVRHLETCQLTSRTSRATPLFGPRIAADSLFAVHRRILTHIRTFFDPLSSYGSLVACILSPSPGLGQRRNPVESQTTPFPTFCLRPCRLKPLGTPLRIPIHAVQFGP
jgi:hypothetical protein